MYIQLSNNNISLAYAATDTAFKKRLLISVFCFSIFFVLFATENVYVFFVVFEKSQNINTTNLKCNDHTIDMHRHIERDATTAKANTINSNNNNNN